MDEINLEEANRRLEWYSKKYGPYIEKRGLKNLGNLFRKPTLNEWIILFMIFMGLIIAWAYNHDTKACRDTLENLEATACLICGEQIRINETNAELAKSYNVSFNLSIFKEDRLKDTNEG